jgi:hypothetical protein
MSLRTRDVPSWASVVEDAPIRESDQKTVTFSTVQYGLLTISRENGLLIRQSVTADDGEVRVLELKELQLNPGKDAIAGISAEWATAGAKEKPVVALMAPLRLLSFQLIIDSAEQGTDTSALDASLEDQYEALRQDPSKTRAAFDESLRWDSPSRMAGRITTRDVEIDGYVIPAATRCGWSPSISGAGWPLSGS